MEVNTLSIKVSIDELLQMLQDMIESDYATVELTFEGGNYEEDSIIKLAAVDPIDNSNVDYGTLCYDDGEL